MSAVPCQKLAVIGGGIIGLSIARAAAQAGWLVQIHCGPDYGTSWVAGGMLTPYSEGWPGEEKHLALGLQSLQLWSDFLHDLPDNIVTSHESLVVGLDSADVAETATLAQWLQEQGHHLIAESAPSDCEPLLVQGLRKGFRAPTELAVDNRLTVKALHQACAQLHVQFLPTISHLKDLSDCDQIVIANGVDAPQLWPDLPIRPVKGEILRLRWRPGCLPIPQRVVRAKVHGRPVYLVPRHDGVVIGATQYESGYDKTPVVTGVRDLLNDAYELAPGLGEYEFVECCAGMRPMTPDNLPIVQRVDPRIIVAAGHGRNGFLLAPWTAWYVVNNLLPKDND